MCLLTKKKHKKCHLTGRLTGQMTFLFFGKIKRFYFCYGFCYIGGAYMNAIADIKRRRGKAGHDFCIDLPRQLIEEYIVALHPPLMEMPGKIIRAYLQKAGYSRYSGRAFYFCRNDIKLPKADSGGCGYIELNAVFGGNGFPAEFFGTGSDRLVQMGKGHNLHMGMADCSPGQGAIVLEENDIVIFTGI